eukprot:11753831-Prorocentrum_lima.AAC.1
MLAGSPGLSSSTQARRPQHVWTMLAGSPGLPSMMQTKHQQLFLDDASRLPRFVFNVANQTPQALFGRC